MTAKRFTIVNDYLIGYDGDYFNLHKPSDIRGLVTVVNALHEENKIFREALKELKEIGDYQAMRIQELDDENEQFKSTIKEAYENERTQIGKNVLKQLIEQIEE